MTRGADTASVDAALPLLPFEHLHPAGGAIDVPAASDRPQSTAERLPDSA